MNKNITMAVVAVILIGASFYGGIQYDKMQIANARQARTGQFANAAGFGGRAGAGGRNGAGFTMGEILSQDDKSITIKMNDGGSVIAFFNASTTVMKSTVGSKKDLVIGQTVTVIGQKNSDGSVNANSIQLRQN